MDELNIDEPEANIQGESTHCKGPDIFEFEPFVYETTLNAQDYSFFRDLVINENELGTMETLLQSISSTLNLDKEDINNAVKQFNL